MKNKKLFAFAISAGVCLLIGAICIMFASKLMNNNDSMSALSYVLIAFGTIFSMSGFVIIFIILVRILKEKKII